MATINPQKDLLAGIAGQSADTITPDQVSFVAGDMPAVFSISGLILTTQTLAALTVVGRDSNGKWVPADGGTTADAEGVLAYAVDSAGGDVEAEIYISGNFNPDLLVWDAAYNTDALKRDAFVGAPSPTQILITKTQTFVAS